MSELLVITRHGETGAFHLVNLPSRHNDRLTPAWIGWVAQAEAQQVEPEAGLVPFASGQEPGQAPARHEILPVPPVSRQVHQPLPQTS